MGFVGSNSLSGVEYNPLNLFPGAGIMCWNFQIVIFWFPELTNFCLLKVSTILDLLSYNGMFISVLGLP